MTRPRQALLIALFAALAAACGPLGPDPRRRPFRRCRRGRPTRLDLRRNRRERAARNPAQRSPFRERVVRERRSGLYVPTSMILGPTDPTERGWVSHVSDDPQVRIRLDGRVFERRAIRVTDAAEFEAARAVLEEKYDLGERDPERTVWIYRLDPRPGSGPLSCQPTPRRAPEKDRRCAVCNDSFCSLSIGALAHGCASETPAVPFCPGSEPALPMASARCALEPESQAFEARLQRCSSLTAAPVLVRVGLDARPVIVAGPPAGENRSDGIFCRKRRSGSSFSIPITES